MMEKYYLLKLKVKILLILEKYFTQLYLNIGLRVILAVMAYTTNSHCKVRGGFTDVMLAFAGLIAYFMY